MGNNIYLYIKKSTRRIYISRDHLDWVFPDKCSLKVGTAVRGFTFKLAPKVNDDFLEPSTGLINKETGQEEFSSVPTKDIFSREEKVLRKL